MAHIDADAIADRPTVEPVSIDLYWIPLGADATVVRVSGKIYEFIAATLQRRRRCDLYHSALIVRLPSGPVAVEMAPALNHLPTDRDVVIEGPVGLRWLGRFRAFRYEVRCWRNGAIPDANEAVAVVRIEVDSHVAQRMLDRMTELPAVVWGRDELRTGEMWNSNSVTAWALRQGNVDTSALAPPERGRAPGWDAGLIVAARGRTIDAARSARARRASGTEASQGTRAVAPESAQSRRR